MLHITKHDLNVLQSIFGELAENLIDQSDSIAHEALELNRGDDYQYYTGFSRGVKLLLSDIDQTINELKQIANDMNGGK